MTYAPAQEIGVLDIHPSAGSTHPERFKPLKPQSVAMRTLAAMVEQRRALTDDKTRFTNRLGDTLKQYYPQALEWFDHRDTILFCDFLTRWPTQMHAKKARKFVLEAFFKVYNLRSAKLIATRIEAIKASKPLTRDAAVITSHRLLALVLVEKIRITLQTIDRFDQEIATLAPAAARERQLSSGCLACTGIQVDSDPFPVLEKSHTL